VRFEKGRAQISSALRLKHNESDFYYAPGDRRIHKGWVTDQVRDYDRYLRDPVNITAVLQGLGYLPDDSKLAVLIGRAPKSEE